MKRNEKRFPARFYMDEIMVFIELKTLTLNRVVTFKKYRLCYIYYVYYIWFK